MFGRGRKKTPEETPEAPAETVPEAANPAVDEAEYVDLGAIQLKVLDGLSLQLPTEDGQLLAVVVVTDDSAMELRAFAASRSGGEWASISAQIAEEIAGMKGTWRAVDGPFGQEIHADVPATDAQGNTGIQRTRMIGVEGPRWLLRATLFGAAAEPDGDDDHLIGVLREAIVVRGPEPRIVGEPLTLTMPEGVQIPDTED